MRWSIRSCVFAIRGCLMIAAGCARPGIDAGTRPATSAADPAPITSKPLAASNPVVQEILVREIHDTSPGGTVGIRIEGDTLQVNAVSPKGIGGTRLVLNSGAWPTKVIVHLSYAPGQLFPQVEGSGALLEATGRASNEPRTHLNVTELTKDGFSFSIPPTPFKVLYIFWVDAYRR